MNAFKQGILFGLIMFGLFMLGKAFADEAPAYLKDGVVTVTLTDGKTYTFSSNEYAVVPREQMGESLPQEIIESVQRLSKLTAMKSAVKIYGGYGADGYSVSHTATGAKVKQSYGLNYGLGLQHSLTDTTFVDGILIFNQSGTQGGLLGLGFKF